MTSTESKAFGEKHFEKKIGEDHKNRKKSLKIQECQKGRKKLIKFKKVANGPKATN